VLIEMLVCLQRVAHRALEQTGPLVSTLSTEKIGRSTHTELLAVSHVDSHG